MVAAPHPDPRTSAPKRGINGAIVRVWGGKDLSLTVLEREDPAEDLVRLRVDLDGLLARDDVYPTYWLRLWFTAPSGKGHQRAYTLVSPDAEAGTAWLEFFLHEGTASDWARGSRPGDRIEATVLNGRDPVAGSPAHLLLVGDGASFPAIADTLRRRPGIPATVLLEDAGGQDWMALPERAGLTVRRLAPGGAIVEEALTAAGTAPAGTVAFVALEGAPTRALSSGLRRRVGLPREQVHALAYWKRG